MSEVSEEVKQEADQLARDLIGIVNDSSHIVRRRWQSVDKVKLVQDLCIYIVKRDQKILEHGFNMGSGKEAK